MCGIWISRCTPQKMSWGKHRWNKIDKMSMLKLDDRALGETICSTFVYLKIPIIKRVFFESLLAKEEKDIFVTRCPLDALEQEPITWHLRLIGWQVRHISLPLLGDLQHLRQEAGHLRPQHRRAGRAAKRFQVESLSGLGFSASTCQIKWSPTFPLALVYSEAQPLCDRSHFYHFLDDKMWALEETWENAQPKHLILHHLNNALWEVIL